MKKANACTIISLFLVIAMDAIGVGLIWPLFGPLFMDVKSSIFSPTTSILVRDILYGITISVYPICMFLGAPIMGDLSDRLGRKNLLLVCLYGTFLGFSICATAVILHSILLLIIGRIFLGLFAASMAIAQAAMIDISPTGKKSFFLGIISLAVNCGFVFGPILGGVLTNTELSRFFTYSTPFIVAAILSFSNAIFLSLSFKEISNFKINKQNIAAKNFNTILFAFKNNELRILSLTYLFVQFGSSFYLQFSIVNFVQAHHFSSTQLGYFLAGYYAIFSLSTVCLLPYLLRFFSLKNIVQCALLIASLAFALMISNQTKILVIMMIPGVASAAIAYNGLITFLSNSVSSQIQGKVMGLAGAIHAASWGLAALLSGVLGYFHTPFFFLVSTICIGVGFTFLCFKEKYRGLPLISTIV